MAKSSNNSRLLFLQHLVREISTGSDLAGADSEVVDAVLRLDDTFCGTRTQLPSRDSSMAGEVPKSHHPDHSSKLVSGSCDPKLPPIIDDKLELAVFTHPALSNNNNTTYDRLEILGDAYIELIATKLVWERFPDLPAGRISQIREILVKNETLSGFAEKIWFGPQGFCATELQYPVKAMDQNKGRRLRSLPEHWLAGLWVPILKNLGHQKGELRSKEALAKKIMGKSVKLEYLEERPSIQQKGGTQTFFVALYLTGWGWNKRFLGSGQGLSKAAAGDEAAKKTLLNTPLILEIMSAKESWESDS
ncbi:Ribonuclease III [Penicillium concentricum]|uniref:Ribonuclease III n=1 Tax=Penicillium concentricum TaxID=293559 RepID=A0A9W9VJN9_9EURO|nr:Ribonuclease III [Penicillium concentricum]KAJ5383319.1 Ribonuclease III [Penicillium concentricum]